MVGTVGVVTSLVVLAGSGVAHSQSSVTVSGTVRGPDGAAVPGTEIRLYTEASINFLEPVSTCFSGAQGSYACSAAAGEYYVAAFPPAGSWLAFTFYPNAYPGQVSYALVDATTSRNDIDFSVVEGGRIAFTLLDGEDSPVTIDVAVQVLFADGSNGIWYDDLAFDRTTGRYESSVLPVGRYRVGLTPIGSDDFDSQQYYCGVLTLQDAMLLEVTAGSVTEPGDCHLRSGEPVFAISGEVADPDRRPVADVVVRALDAEKNEVARTVTSIEGRYELVVPSGAWFVHAVPALSTLLAPAYYPGTQRWTEAEAVTAGGTGINVQLATGGTLDFQLLASGVSIDFPCEVTVYDATDPRPSDWVPVLEVESDDTGAFSAVVEPGTYTVVLQPPPDSGFVAPQSLCNRYEFTSADRYEVEAGSHTDAGECEIVKDYPRRTTSGGLFSYDHEWVVNPEDVENWSSVAGAAADLNNDGLVDLVTNHSSDLPDNAPYAMFRYAVLINQGGNRFRSQGRTWVPGDQMGRNCLDLEAADLDCDGWVDMLVACQGEPQDPTDVWGEQDRAWRNVGGTHFEDVTDLWMPLDDPQSYGIPADDSRAWVTADFDVGDIEGDGDIDAIRTTAIEAVLLNDGTGRLEVLPPPTHSNGGPSQAELFNGTSSVLGDLTGDGILDAVFTTYPLGAPDERIDMHCLAVGRSDGTFEPMGPEIAPPRYEGAEVAGFQAIIADFDGDDIMDAFVCNGFFMWQFDDPTSPEDQVPYFGPLDELLLNRGLVNGMYPRLENATEQIVQTPEANTSAFGAAADIDSDGDEDVLVPVRGLVRHDYTKPELTIAVNDGHGFFDQMPRSMLPEVVALVLRTVPFDSDNDGDVDVLLVCGDGERHILLINRLLEKHDLDGDGYVTTADAEEVRARLGTTDEGQPEDVNADGVVDAKDLSLVLRFQTTVRADNSTLTPACEPGGAR